jgi:antitoxin component of MazEF toxin-antitoxin module
MTQKIINIGNSAGITLNQQYLNQMGLSLGDKVTTEFYPETKKIIISLSKDKQDLITDKQVLVKLGNLKKRYGKLYQKLAQQSEETLS